MEREILFWKNVPKQNWQKNIQIPCMKIAKSLLSSSWWFQPTQFKTCESKMGIFNLPQFCGMKITNLFELPPPSHMTVTASLSCRVSIQVTAALEGAICSSAMAWSSQVSSGETWSLQWREPEGSPGSWMVNFHYLENHREVPFFFVRQLGIAGVFWVELMEMNGHFFFQVDTVKGTYKIRGTNAADLTCQNPT